MFDLVLQCTLSGNHALQVHLQHEKNDNSGQGKTSSCVHRVCNGFCTITNNSSSQEYCTVTTGAPGIKTSIHRSEPVSLTYQKELRSSGLCSAWEGF